MYASISSTSSSSVSSRSSSSSSDDDTSVNRGNVYSTNKTFSESPDTTTEKSTITDTGVNIDNTTINLHDSVNGDIEVQRLASINGIPSESTQLNNESDLSDTTSDSTSENSSSSKNVLLENQPEASKKKEHLLDKKIKTEGVKKQSETQTCATQNTQVDEKAFKTPVRPKTAKPPRYPPRRPPRVVSHSSTSSVDSIRKGEAVSSQNKRSPNKSRKPRSSVSSVSTLEDDSFEAKENEHIAEELQYRDVQIKELLLHKYLDRHLAKQLNLHRAEFERGVSGGSGFNRRRRTSTTSKRRKEPNSVRLARSTYGRKQPTILSGYTPQLREAEVKRTIKQLVAELAKYQGTDLKSDSRTNSAKFNIETSHSRKRQNKRLQKELLIDKNDSSSEDSTTASSSSSESSTNESATKSTTQINVIVPSGQKNETQTDEDNCKNNDVKHRENELQKSILKSNSNTKKEKAKRVRVVDQKRRKKSPRPSTHHYSNVSRRDELTSHSYLSVLLDNLGESDYLMADNYGQFHRVTLQPAPVNRYPSRRRWTAHPDRKKERSTRQVSKAVRSNKDKPKDMQKYQEKENTESIKGKGTSGLKSSSAKNQSNNEGNQSSTNESEYKASPRIRPGTEPIKCNWKPEKQNPVKKEVKTSDCQLRNSSNPAILEWLDRKNALAKQQRIHKVKENRTKRNMLMQEFNEKEDKKEHALIEYEKWKKQKNREILLRRRRETLEANGGQKEKQPLSEQHIQAKSFSNNHDVPDSTVTTFSDLRSSATPLPTSEAKNSSFRKDGTRPRPKSAPTKVSFGTPVATYATKPDTFIPVKFDFESGDVTVLSPKQHENSSNLSAREPIMQKQTDAREGNFMKELLDVDRPKSMFDVPPPGTFFNDPNAKQEEVDRVIPKVIEKSKRVEREHYNNWMRSNGTSSPYQMKKSKKKRKNKASSKQEPAHDPATNDLISDLAKRRIKKILDQKKRVDTGIGMSREAAPKAASSNLDSEGQPLERWTLKEDFTSDQNSLPRNGSKRKSSNAKVDKEKRPVFSYNKKTNSKSIFHERNPVINQALNT